MTDNELIARIESKLPQELTLEELELLHRRVRESRAVREAVASQIELHEALAAVVGRIEMPAEKIVADARNRFRSHGFWAWLGWTACLLLLLAAVGISLLWPNRSTRSGNLAPPLTNNAVPPVKTRSRALPAPAMSVVVIPQPINHVALKPNAEAVAKSPPVSGEIQSAIDLGLAKPAPELAKSPATDNSLAPADSPPPQPPWQRPDQLGQALRPWDDAALESVGADLAADRNDQSTDSQSTNAEQAPSVGEVRQWFTDDGRLRFIRSGGFRRSIPSIAGLAQFNAPWTDDNVLRISLTDCVPMAFHFWNGQRGLTLWLNQNAWSLTAYRTERDAGQATPNRYVTVATDDRRNWNTCGGKFPLRLDLRFHAGELIVSRGEFVLLRAPFTGLPTETYFEGRASIAGLDMVRVSGAPPAEPDLLPIARDIPRPADLEWHAANLPNRASQNRHGGQSNTIPPVQFNKLADGAVEMRTDDEQSSGAEWIELPNDGVCEIELELDHVAPGARIVFGGSGTTTPLASVGFFRDKPMPADASGDLFSPLPFAGEGLRRAQPSGPGVSGQCISCRLAHLFDQRIPPAPSPDAGPCAFAAPHQWIRLVAGCGLTRLSGSVDGQHWARFGIGVGDIWSEPIARVGLCCMPGDAPRSIMLRRIRIREFHELAQLAPAELLVKAPPISAGSYAEWRDETETQKPAATQSADWRRACSLKTLRSDGRGELGRQLLAMLLGDSLAMPMSVERRLRLVHEIGAISDVYSDGNAATALVGRFELVGEQLIRQQCPAPWTALERAVLDAPIWSAGTYSTYMPALARAELLQAVYSAEPRQVLRTAAQLRLMHCADRLTQWAERWAAAQAGVSGQFDALADHAGDSPLIDESDKETFSTLAEFDSALDSGAYHDACQIMTGQSMTSAETGRNPDLVQDPRDPQRLVSLDTAFSAATSGHPKLRGTMNAQFAAIGMLEARRAMSRSEAGTIGSVATRYQDTPAAAEACLWLGDRAIGGGQFNQARALYRRAMENGGATFAKRAAPRDRLAAAMLGQDSGSPATEAVQFGEVNMPADRFEALVSEMRNAHAAGEGASVGPWGAMPTALRGHAFAIRSIASFDGDMGAESEVSSSSSPSRSLVERWLRPIDPLGNISVARSPEMLVNLDWAGRQLAVAANGARFYASNRFQVVAYDARSGQALWRSELAGEHGRTHDWTMEPMRPLPIGPRVFVRRLTRSHVELAALDAEIGAVLWRSPPSLMLVSDPVWLGGEVAAIVASRGEEQTTFSLVAFDPADGSVRSSQSLAALRDAWWSERTCQLTQAGDDLVAVLCGAVVCCDSAGKARWIRRQTWLSPEEDPAWARQSQTPPLVVGSKLLVTQPGVMAVECIDLHDGSLVWRSAMPGIHRAIGAGGGSLFAETDYGIAALSIADGKLVWYHPAADLLEGRLCGDASQLAFTCLEPVAGNNDNTRPVLVGLDTADGHEIARQPFAVLPPDDSRIGPFIATGHHLWFFAGNLNEPSRTLFELHPRPSAVGSNGRRVPVQARPVGQSF